MSDRNVAPGADARVDPGAGTGSSILRASLVGTGVFAVAATAAAIRPDPLAVPVAVLDGVFFTVGCILFVWSFLRAVVRSRTDAISVTSIWFLSGSAPAPVRRVLLGSLAAQVVVALITASVRPFTPLAFGILVPVYGLGLCGVWAAHHGSFPGKDEV